MCDCSRIRANGDVAIHVVYIEGVALSRDLPLGKDPEYLWTNDMLDTEEMSGLLPSHLDCGNWGPWSHSYWSSRLVCVRVKQASEGVQSHKMGFA